MEEKKVTIEPIIERQEDQAMILFLRQRCLYLAQALSLEQRIVVSLKEDLHHAKTEMLELKESILKGK